MMFAFVRRRVIEQTIWVRADTAKAAREYAKTGLVRDTNDEETLSMTLRRVPAEDRPDRAALTPSDNGEGRR